jgi:PadR family transcriptional regulator, regulatory protein PadR
MLSMLLITRTTAKNGTQRAQRYAEDAEDTATPTHLLLLCALRVPLRPLRSICSLWILLKHDSKRLFERSQRARVLETWVLRSGDLFYKIGVMTTPSVGSLELAALLAVVRLGDAAYGLAVRQDLTERMERDYSVGAVYTTLQRLEDKGLLRSRASEPLPVRGGRSRRHFSLTGAGARAIREAQRESASMWAGVSNRLGPKPA